ncbi:MAG: hypothetical protein LRY36_02605 [Alphaproteobacteria bacterium]|nr:hypothetical protein [Alphaproteobacteria bacterium]
MTDRISETDLVIPALRVMATKPNGFITTENLIQELEDIFQPTGKDANILDGRNDTHFSQKVRNLVSHRNQPSNFIYKGYAEYLPEKEGLRITPEGQSILEKIAA